MLHYSPRKGVFLFCLLALLLQFPLSAHRRKAVAPPIMGWSSWNTYRIHISDTLICRQADAMVKTGLKKAGYRYVNIDDGFFGRRDAQGRLTTHPVRFPQGLKPVAAHIHRLGLKAGIYSDAGSNTCGSIWDADTMGIGVGLYGHEEQDMRFFLNDCRFDFIKVDFCGGQSLGLDEHMQYARIAEAIRSTGRSDVSLNICRWAYPGIWASALASSWRTTADIRPSWSSVRDIIRRNLYLSAFGGEGHYNDMDMLEIGRGLSATEEQTHFGLWCMMCSPLLIGCDLTHIPSSSLSLLCNPELIALNQEAPCRNARVVLEENGCYVLAKDLKKKYGRVRAVAFYNPTEQERTLSASLSLLELTGKVKVRDLMNRTSLAPVRDTLTATIPAHGVRIFRIEGARTEPVRYEAEWAMLPLFNAIGKGKRMALAREQKGARCGAVVTGLGGSPKNHAEWSDVYSRKGGRYTLLLRFSTPDDRELEITVNDRTHVLRLPAGNGQGEDMQQVSLPVTLRKGLNTLRMGNAAGPAPDIDGFELHPE